MRTRSSVACQKGASLIEMMIAILVLTVGLIGSAALMAVAISSNARSRRDSTSTAVAQLVLDQISAVPLGGSTTSLTITDCAGNSTTVNTSGTTAGSGANLTGSGSIDFTQSFGSVSAGYAMTYTVCSVSNGLQTAYDVRWNVTKLPSGKEEFVVVGAQILGTNSNSPQFFAAPVSIRTVVGNAGT